MYLKEYQGYELLRKYGIPVPEHSVICHPAELAGLDLAGEEFAVKAQMPMGSRKKAGAIIFCGREGLENAAKALLGRKFGGIPVSELVIERKIPHDTEHYISLSIDTIRKEIVLLFSDDGGIDVEDLRKERIRRLAMDGMDGEIERFFAGLKHEKELVALVKRMLLLMKEMDCELVEINPLVFSRGEPLPLDSKIIIDDNSLYRHPKLAEMKERGLSELELLAERGGLSFVQLDGDIGVIGNGAGLVMATLDLLVHHGGRPKNFLDVRGGTGSDAMLTALGIITREAPRKLLINIFGGITRCDEIAEAVVRFRRDKGINIPFVVRLVGTNDEEAIRILEEAGIHALRDMEEAVKKVVCL
jgi:succinyl-CoA synthetase beta subunit